MTDHDLSFLKSQIDQVVLIETSAGERHLGQILFVFEEGETPDVFYLKVERGPEGGYVQQGSGGFSVLLSEIAAVQPARRAIPPWAERGLCREPTSLLLSKYPQATGVSLIEMDGMQRATK